MKKGFFEYTCTFWDEYTREIKTAHGVVFTSSFTNAMYEIGKCYGEDNINSVSLDINEHFSYNNEDNYRKKHEGTFRKCCQTCYDYKAKKGAMPRRKDLRKEKREKWMKDDRNFS